MAVLAITLWLCSLALAGVSANITNIFALTNKELLTNNLVGDQYLTISKLRSLAVEFFDHYSNATMEDLTPDLNEYFNGEPRIPSVQDLECLADLALLSNDLASSKFWALKSKFPNNPYNKNHCSPIDLQ